MGDVVEVSGSLPEVLGYKYNTVTVICYRDRKLCLFVDVESIGHTDGTCQVSRLDPPLEFEIQQWSDAKMVANLPGLLCGGGQTWVIDRRLKAAEVTSDPPTCPGPFERTMAEEKQDLEKMLKERPELATDSFFTSQMTRVNEGLAAAATYRKTIYHANIDDPPYWKDWKKKFEGITGKEPK